MAISVLLPFVYLDRLGIQERMGLEEMSRSKPNKLKAPLSSENDNTSHAEAPSDSTYYEGD
jgi:hypothetical protein